jgi:integrase
MTGARRRRTGMGRVFQRKSRLTGKPLPTYWIGYYVRGESRERQESTRTTDYAEALRRLKERQGEVARGDLQPNRLDRRTVNDLLELVRKDYADTSRTLPRGHVEAFAATIGHIPARQVHREMLDDLVRAWKREGPTWPGRVARRCQPISGTACNHYMALLSRGYSLAKEKWGLVTGLTFPHERETARGRYMPPATFYAIHEHLPTRDIQDVFELAYLNGIRKGQLRKTEVPNVVVKHVAGAERWELSWRGDQTKAGKRDGQPHTIPLTGRSLAIVKAAFADRQEGCPFLFHSIKCGRFTKRHHADDPCLGRLQSEWTRACTAAGVPCGRKEGGYVFHNTRHSAVTNMTGAGIPDSVATTITGHRSLAIFKRYGIRQESVQRAALEKVEHYVRGLTEETAAGAKQGAA